MKLFFMACLILLTGSIGKAQTPRLDVFIRLPHVFNAGLREAKYTFATVMSAGLTVHYGRAFADAGLFGGDGVRGYYLYNAVNVWQRSLDGPWQVALNGFAEGSRSVHTVSPYTVTLGISPVLVNPANHHTFVIALTSGAAWQGSSLSWNTRIIFNLSIPIIRR